MTIDTRHPVVAPDLQKRIEELSKLVARDKLESAVAHLGRFLESLHWETPRPEGADLEVALDLAISLSNSPGGNPERLSFHNVPLGPDGYDGEGVVVEGCHGDGKFHCYYYEELPWITMTAAEIEADASQRKGPTE